MEGNMNKMVCLNGRNYNIWKTKMKDLLFVKKMHLPIFTAHKLETVTNENWDFEHQQVCGYIRQWVEDDALNHFVNETHVKTLIGCKACVHVPKDERSKLDVKTKQCIFIGYGQDEFGYRFYDPIDKKLIRSRDVVFFEDQTIEDIGKAEKPDSQIDESLVDVDPVRIIDTSFAHEATQYNDADNDQGVYPIDFPIDDVVVDHQPTCVEMTTSDALETSCRRSAREK
ncbi:hypothetical protein KY289_013346 [Solanum tuberosum]|nr:hypothetical protein KY289_013346 [Solanum tuberosum]